MREGIRSHGQTLVAESEVLAIVLLDFTEGEWAGKPFVVQRLGHRTQTG